MSLLSMMTTFPDAGIADIQVEGNGARIDPAVDGPPQVSPEAPAAKLALYVATDLRSWATDRPDWFRADVQIDDTAYRQLDPEYYAWLRSRMSIALRAHQAGEIDGAAFEELRTKFNAVHQWAVEHLGEPALAEAVGTLMSREYRPPVAEPEAPARGRRKAGASYTSTDAVAMVDAICARALSLGWNRERLYATGNGHFDPQRGLICFLKLGDQIGEVTAQSIEIIHPLPSEVRHRFYNPDVEQPWVKKVGATRKNPKI